MDNSKFEDLKRGLDGRLLVERLSKDFEILIQFKEIKIGLPSISYTPSIDLEVLIKKMLDYEFASQSQWKEVYRLGNTKINFPAEA